MRPVIFIPTYNSERYIERTLESLIAQDGVDPFAICVVDNDSLDNTRKLASKFKNVEVFKNRENIGRVQNWNKCLELFKKQEAFDCMKFVFAGDRLKKHCLRTQLKYLSVDNLTPIVTCAHKVIQRAGNYTMRHLSENRVLTPKESLKMALKKGNWIAGCMACPMFTKEALGDTKFKTSLEWASDWFFWTELSEKSKIQYLDASLVQFNMEARQGYKKMAGSQQAQEEEEFIYKPISDNLK